MTASHGSELWRHFRKDKTACAGMLILAALILVAVLGKLFTEWLVIFDPAEVRLMDKLLPPLSQASTSLPALQQPLWGLYLLGTDDLGRDIFSRMLQGSFVSLSIGLVAMSIAVVVGILIGATAGFFAERRFGPLSIDTLLMRFTDIVLCFPSFFLILTVVALLPANIYYIMVVLGLTSWMGIARLVRAEFLSLRKRDFVLAAIASGIPTRRLILVHILPNALGPILVAATISVASAILTESALSFLGFGVQPPDATWGNILADGKNYIFDAPWMFFIPGSAIFVIVLAFNLVGEGLREASHPRLRKR